jgi:hypothetical protein
MGPVGVRGYWGLVSFGFKLSKYTLTEQIKSEKMRIASQKHERLGTKT